MLRVTLLHRFVFSLLIAVACWSAWVPLTGSDADRDTANSYDNAWKSAWVTHLKAIKTAQGGSHTTGFVIHLGDSITYANQYGQYQSSYNGSNPNDIAAIAYSRANGTAPNLGFGSIAPNNKNGWNLAKEDLPRGGAGINRSYTASSGITSGQWLVGGGSHGAVIGNNSVSDPTPVDNLIANSSTAVNGNGVEVAIVSDAQAVLIMLGTNDIGSGVAATTVKNNLQTIVGKFEAANIMVILSTIPPRVGKETEAIAVNTEIKNLAQAMNLPLIDFHAEIMRRRPGIAWQGTLIQGDGVHPTFGAYVDPDVDPTVLDSNGYELRGFLTIAKLWEVKNYVIDGNPLPSSGPTITTQPSNVTVTVGSPATFTVAATGSGTLTYQWKKGATNVGTGASYTIASTTAGDAGSYSVVVTDANGSTTSNTVTLTVNTPPPTITTQPSSQTVNVGNPVTFTVVATGSGLSYQWKKGATNVGTGASYTIASTTVSDAGNYTVVVSNAGGSVTSNIAVLTVIGPPAITTQPGNQSVVVGSTATFTVVATGSGTLTYQWQKNSAPIAGATSASYTTPATVIGDSGSQYRVVVTNSAGSTTSNQATLTVTASAVAPTITTHPASQTVTLGASATFSVAASGTAPFTYQWQKNGGNIGGATGASYTTPGTTLGDNLAQYRVIVTNAGGSATSNAAVLTVTSGANPITPSTSAVTLAAAVGSATPVITTITLTNSTGGAITVTPSSSAAWLTPGGAVTVPGGGTATLTLTGDPSGLSGAASGTLTLTNSTGGSQTMPVSFTIGQSAGLKKRGCSIGSGAHSDLLVWLTGLVLLAGLMAFRHGALKKLAA